MMKIRIREKITGLLVFYFVLALVAIGSTLFVSWKLEGGAAAINDAGRERMRSYRIAYLLGQHVHHPTFRLQRDIEQEIALFENTLTELQHGNPQRPLFLPRGAEFQSKMQSLLSAWQDDMKPRIQLILEASGESERDKLLAEYRPAVESFVDGVNELVAMVEKSNAQGTELLRSIQMALVIVALLGTVLLDFIFSLLLVRPVQRLQQGLQSMGKADFNVRLPVTSNDELGELAQGFNFMAERLQDIYATLEQRVADKTRSIEIKNRELGTLYEVAAFLNSCTSAEPLCDNVLGRMVALIGAQGGVVRLTDPKGEQLQVVAARGVSEPFLAEEAVLAVGSCICGEVARDGIAVSSDFTMPSTPLLLNACNKAGYRAVAAIPIRSNQRVLGMFNLFFDSVRILPPGEVRLLESVGLHLGIAIENQRLAAREREMAVSEERNLLAQELHDSIAQSLAFLNIQVQMLHQDLSKKNIADAMQVLDQIREGVQESYDDVRELLVHFRTRLEHADLDGAIVKALEKFEGQIGIVTHYERHGPNPDIPPEHVLQVMHILQESLSNIRKHSGATRVDVELKTEGQYCLSVQDDGKGFDSTQNAGDTHVGIRIMRERARRFGGEFSITSTPGQGTRVSLVWNPIALSTEQRSAA
jgi:two-component system nitrate/nitrite sensor histidine kinase NarX